MLWVDRLSGLIGLIQQAALGQTHQVKEPAPGPENVGAHHQSHEAIKVNNAWLLPAVAQAPGCTEAPRFYWLKSRIFLLLPPQSMPRAIAHFSESEMFV